MNLVRWKEDSRLVKVLVAWYGFYQATHLLVNVRGLIRLSQGGIDFPALPPLEGWAAQVIPFFIGVASLDALNAVFTLVYVVGYFRKTPWQTWLGTLTLTVSMYAALLFDFATYLNGAWTGPNLAGYWFINLTFLPVVILFALTVMWGLRGGLGPAGFRDNSPQGKPESA